MRPPKGHVGVVGGPAGGPTAETWRWYAWRLWRDRYEAWEIARWLCLSYGLDVTTRDVAEYVNERTGAALAVLDRARAQDRADAAVDAQRARSASPRPGPSLTSCGDDRQIHGDRPEGAA